MSKNAFKYVHKFIASQEMGTEADPKASYNTVASMLETYLQIDGGGARGVARGAYPR
jgi:hypothetical protein